MQAEMHQQSAELIDRVKSKGTLISATVRSKLEVVANFIFPFSKSCLKRELIRIKQTRQTLVKNY